MEALKALLQYIYLSTYKQFILKALKAILQYTFQLIVEAVQETYLCTNNTPYRSCKLLNSKSKYRHKFKLNSWWYLLRTCRVHCRYTNMFPDVPQHAQGFYVSTISWKVYCRREFNAPKIAYFELYLFFRHPVFNFFKYMNF